MIGAVNLRKLCADQNARVSPCIQKQMGKHCACGGFSVHPRNADGIFMPAHQRRQKIRAVDHAQPKLLCAQKLRIIRSDRRIIYNHILLPDLFCIVPDIHRDTSLAQALAVRAVRAVRPGDGVAAPRGKICQSAHGYPADAEKIKAVFFGGNSLQHIVFAL